MQEHDRLGFVAEKKRAFELAFRSVAGQTVLHELAPFCRANESCYDDDPRRHALAEGRREVWLRIMKYLELTPDELIGIYRGRHFQPNTGDEE